MVSCASCGMSHITRGKGVRFHRLPKNPEQRKAWLRFINMDESNVTKTCNICTRHFRQEDIDRSSTMKLQLKKNVVPTITVLREKYGRCPQVEFEVVKPSTVSETISSSKNARTLTDDHLYAPKTSSEIAKKLGKEPMTGGKKKPKCDCFWLTNRVEKLEKFIEEQNDTIVQITALLLKFLKKKKYSKPSLVCHRTCRRHCR